ncbi:uvrABC system protein A [Clostridium sp. CAG:354]|jgi:excinuclease ABC subunit A|nr:excinuclease ABC subunit UvrA [Clostridium sp.]MEE0268196.1 excinuclease ABC subunit UvrA [Clostridia bacterium]CDE10346.1 uvrABC system protein A [Clostridium sp. CAG:354]
MNDKIIIKGAKEHNLKNINLEIPRDKLVVVTGLSGSGKSSLAFDTLYAEGQRRYVESLSSYARQFLGLMEKPDVESIEGLSPAISIDQKTTSKNPRSTVGTVTEIYDYIRLLYARIGVPYCPICGKKIEKQTIDQIIDNIMKLEEGTKIQVIAPIIRGRKGEYTKLIQDLLKEGFIRARIDGENIELSDDIKIDRKKKHNIDLIVDRLVIKPDIRSRLTESVEIALKHADNIVTIDVPGNGETLYSQNYACPDCGFSFPELTPRMFSFNNPQGACPECTGIGYLLKMDEDLIIPDKNKTLYDGVKAFGSSTMKKGETMAKMYFETIGKHYGVDIKVPIKKLPRDFLDKILYGTGDECIDFEHESPFGIRKFSAPFEGVIPTLERRHNETKSQGMREFYEMYMSESPCHACHGARLRKEILSIKVGDKNINELTDMPINKIRDYLKSLELTNQEKLIGEQIFKEIDKRLNFLIDVGLEYLTLSRSAGSLSGGESQRIRLATQIGSGLTGVLYILDEPSIGLHQRDNDKLLATLKKLRDLGNTLLVVEHDEDTMYAADQIIDIGPGAGVHGGNVMAQGTAEEIKKVENSITGQYLSGRKNIPVPKKRRKTVKGKAIEVKGATEHNLKNISVKFPLGVFNCVTGVSGSGKSTLVNEILYKTITKQLNGSNEKPGKCKEVVGIDKIDKIINIDQSPIGRTPRSNPATYTGVFDTIREIFANTNEAKLRGYQKGRFSFNVQGGRCEACNGDGLIKIEMHFLPDIYVPCEVCKGKRYNHETLEVKYKGKTIADVLDMTVEEALDFFNNIPKIKQKIQTLYDVGLGYIKLGQPSTTLSGGEAQRVKLATELSKRATGKTLYILDEPTTGLHIADVHRLVDILQRLVDTGNTIIVIEHNLDLIKTCDHIIDLGPEGGDGGGEIVAVGTPEQICKNDRSYTGKFLKKYLED